MENQYSIWQRITSDTPSFFKRVQVLGLGLAAMGKALTESGFVPPKVCTLCIAVGSTLIILAQFAVKQYTPLTANHNDDTK